VGSCTDAWPITDANRVFVDLTGPLELLSISGNISRREDGAAHLHIHVTVSTGGPVPAACYGGHLVSAEVYSTAELAIAALDGIRLARRHDPETKTLELYPESV
jgi:predicted DNA-binding protein with PD1-like motif